MERLEKVIKFLKPLALVGAMALVFQVAADTFILIGGPIGGF